MYGTGVEYSCSVTGKGAERTVGGASLLENGMVLTCADAGSKKRTVLHRWHEAFLVLDRRPKWVLEA